MPQDQQRPNSFSQIPTHILNNPEISDSEAILFGRISSLSNDSGYCFASDKYLAELTRVSTKEVGKRLKKLELFGYIKRVTKKNGILWDRKIFPNYNYEPSTQRTRTLHTDDSNAPYGGDIYISKYIDKKEETSSRNSVPLSEQSFRRAEFLSEKIKENNEKAKKPNIERWAKEIDKLNRIDNYSWEEIDELISFSQSDEFWHTVILSASSLRRNAGKLTLKIKKASKKSPQEQKEERIQANMELCERIKKERDINGMLVFDTFVQIVLNGFVTKIQFTENGFNEQLENALRKGGY